MDSITAVPPNKYIAPDKQITQGMRGDGHSRIYDLGHSPRPVIHLEINGCSAIPGIDYTTIYSNQGKLSVVFTEPPLINDVIGISYDITPQHIRYFWCPHCLAKCRLFEQIASCLSCGERVIQLDINDDVFLELPEKCTKGDIMEASIGVCI